MGLSKYELRVIGALVSTYEDSASSAMMFPADAEHYAGVRRACIAIGNILDIDVYNVAKDLRENK